MPSTGPGTVLVPATVFVCELRIVRKTDGQLEPLRISIPIPMRGIRAYGFGRIDSIWLETRVAMADRDLPRHEVLHHGLVINLLLHGVSVSLYLRS